MPGGDAPDYWLRGQVIELIKLVEKIKLIEQIDLIDVIGKIKLIKSIVDVPFTTNPLRNSRFETGDLEGWYWSGVKAEVVSPAFDGDFCCRLSPNTVVGQLLPPQPSLNSRLILLAKADRAGDVVECYLEFTDGTTEAYMESLFVEWYPIYCFFKTKKTSRRLFFQAPKGNVSDIYIDFVNLVSPALAFETIDAVTSSGSKTATEPGGLQVSINNDYRQLVQFRATLIDGGGEIRLEASHNGTDWFPLWTKTLPEPGSYCDWDFCGFPWFRVNVPTTGIGINIDIRAVRL